MSNLWTKIKKCLQAEMLQKMWKEFLWIAQYARRYWKAMIFYTATWCFRNRCFSCVQCDIERSG